MLTGLLGRRKAVPRVCSELVAEHIPLEYLWFVELVANILEWVFTFCHGTHS